MEALAILVDLWATLGWGQTLSSVVHPLMSLPESREIVPNQCSKHNIGCNPLRDLNEYVTINKQDMYVCLNRMLTNCQILS